MKIDCDETDLEIAPRLESAVDVPRSTDHSVDPESRPSPILPVAHRDTEITEGDVETMLRVARDKNAPSGRYRRTPKFLPKGPLAK